MTLKHSFNTKPNPKYNAGKIKKAMEVQAKLNRMLISKAEGQQHAYINNVKEALDENLRAARNELKKQLMQPKVLQEVKITSQKKWIMYPEDTSDETGRTSYGKPKEFSVDVTVPYSRFIVKKDEDGDTVFDENDEPVMIETNMREAIRDAQATALKELKDYRKASREVAFIEKEFNIPGLPTKPKYKVYIGAGNGGPEVTYTYSDKWRGTKATITKPEQKDNYFIHMEGGTFLKLQEAAKTRKVFESKKPMTNEHHVGIEIEFVSKYDKFQLATELCKENVQDFVCLKDDGSIRFVDKNGKITDRATDEFKYKHELTVCAPEVLIHEVIRRILKAVNKDGGSKVGGRCGLHVHLDMRNRDKKLAFYNLSKAQRILYAMNPRSRIDGSSMDNSSPGSERYSKKIDTADFDSALANYGGDRYHGINLNALSKYNTIEIRIHTGSTNEEKISQWVRILTSIVNLTEKVSAEAHKPETFCEYYNLDAMTLEYIKTRVAKFRDKEGNHINVYEVA